MGHLSACRVALKEGSQLSDEEERCTQHTWHMARKVPTVQASEGGITLMLILGDLG